MRVVVERDVMDADDLLASVLADDPGRLRHCRAVGERARDFSVILPAGQRSLLVSAALLHDIGYAESLRVTGFHPLDGALFLRSVGWDWLAPLVAHHSGARFVAIEWGLSEQLQQFDFTEDALTDALTAADQLVGPDGRPISAEDRMVDMLRRHGLDSPNADAHPVRSVYLRAAVHRTRQRLTAAEQAS